MPDLGTILVGIGVVLLVVVVLGAGLARRARRREAADKLRYRSQRRYVLYDGSPLPGAKEQGAGRDDVALPHAPPSGWSDWDAGRSRPPASAPPTRSRGFGLGLPWRRRPLQPNRAEPPGQRAKPPAPRPAPPVRSSPPPTEDRTAAAPPPEPRPAMAAPDLPPPEPRPQMAAPPPPQPEPRPAMAAPPPVPAMAAPHL